MGYKFAVGSSDGENIDLHFGQAEQFYIYETDDNDGYNFVEIRPRELPQDEARRHEVTTGGGGKCGEGGEVDATVIADVQYLLVASIGMNALRSLARQNITAFDVPGSIDKAIKRVIGHNKKIKK
jgi:predicted Fe-Mo cluster-binding NifX family protein